MSERIPPFVRATLIARGLTPPFLWALLKAIRNRPEPLPEAEAAPESEPEPRAAPEWEFVPEGWERPEGGWDVGAIAQTYRAKWPAFLAAVDGPEPLGVNHETPLDGGPMARDDLEAQHMVLAFGYALARAAHGKTRLSVLDWGGGPGHYAVFARALLPELELEYHSRDLPPFVALGQELHPNDAFHTDDGCLDRTYDLVIASSSLQYAPAWQATVAGLARATGGYLFLTRVPVAVVAPSFVVLQRAYRYGYETEFLGWVLNRAELLEEARRAGLELVREILLPAWLSADDAPESPIDHRGFLFAPVN